MQSPTTSRFVLTALFWSASVGSGFSACAPHVVSIRGDFGAARFSVEIADDFDERATGLMNRSSMPKLSGMLFVYENPGNLTFWMRNTLIPLDMIFVKPNGVIGHVHSNAIPLDETPIAGGEGHLAVLEINGGMAEQLGIQAGDTLRHPAFSDHNPIWPCD